MLDKDLKMSDSYLEQRVNIHPPTKLEKYTGEASDRSRDFHGDKEMSRTRLRGATNLEYDTLAWAIGQETT